MIDDIHHNDYQILVLYLLDELSLDERQTVTDWINESETNQKALSAVQRIWEATGRLDPAPVAVDVDRAWEKIQERLAAGQQSDAEPHTRSARVRRLVTWFAVAAIVMMAAATFILTDWFRKEALPEIFTIETFAGIRKDSLQDGSAVIINQGSQMRYADFKAGTHDERLIELYGEAFFDVAADSAKPFIVKTQLGSVKVHGTRFNVSAFSGQNMEVTVEEGLVSLMKMDETGSLVDELYLEAGEKGIISATTGNLYLADEIAPDELYWANRRLIFQETELSQVFSILESYYDFAYELENAAILDCLLTTSFTNQDLFHMLEVIAVTFELELSWEDSVYYFKGNGCIDE